MFSSPLGPHLTVPAEEINTAFLIKMKIKARAQILSEQPDN